MGDIVSIGRGAGEPEPSEWRSLNTIPPVVHDLWQLIQRAQNDPSTMIDRELQDQYEHEDQSLRLILKDGRYHFPLEPEPYLGDRRLLVDSHSKWAQTVAYKPTDTLSEGSFISSIPELPSGYYTLDHITWAGLALTTVVLVQLTEPHDPLFVAKAGESERHILEHPFPIALRDLNPMIELPILGPDGYEALIVAHDQFIQKNRIAECDDDLQ